MTATFLSFHAEQVAHKSSNFQTRLSPIPSQWPKNQHNHNVLVELGVEEEEESACAVFSGMEMKQLQPVMYTSLKDILPASLSSTVSPTYQNSSWNEIPIKNPLVKQAALAYLQPMATRADVGDKGLFGRLKLGECSKECGCLQWIKDVVFRPFMEFFLQRREEVDDDDNDNDHDKIN